MQVFSSAADIAVDEPEITVVTPAGGMHAVFCVQTTKAPQFIDITKVVMDMLGEKWLGLWDCRDNVAAHHRLDQAQRK